MTKLTRASPFVIVPLEPAQKIADRMRTFLGRILALFPSLKYDLRVLEINEPEAYVAANLLSSLFYGAVFGAIMFAGLQSAKDPSRTPGLALGSALAIFALAFVFNMAYPGIRTRTYAIKMGRDLTFALKDMLVQVESGIPLYDAMVNISRSNYGTVSSDFTTSVKGISAGISESVALQKMALKTKNEYFKKALWQLISALESGASIGPALRSVIETLENYQHKSIKDYSASLNFIVLIYMLIAAAIPSMGITFMIILSAFGGIGVNEQLIALIVSGSLLMQLVLIGFVNSGRPTVYD